jgi:cell division cycle protein 37
MMGSLLDQVRKEVDDTKPDDRLEAFITEIRKHGDRVKSLQGELLAKVAELEKEDKKHITSDDIHVGFDYSNVGSRRCYPNTTKVLTWTVGASKQSARSYPILIQ